MQAGIFAANTDRSFPFEQILRDIGYIIHSFKSERRATEERARQAPHHPDTTHSGDGNLGWYTGINIETGYKEHLSSDSLYGVDSTRHNKKVEGLTECKAQLEPNMRAITA